MIAFEKLEEYMILIDKSVEMNNELEALMYRCIDDPSLLDEFSRKNEEYKAIGKAIRDFKLR